MILSMLDQTFNTPLTFPLKRDEDEFLIPEKPEGAVCEAESETSTNVHSHHDHVYLCRHGGAAGRWTLHSRSWREKRQEMTMKMKFKLYGERAKDLRSVEK